MRIACAGCAIRPIYHVADDVYLCHVCYLENDFCDCEDCLLCENPCQCDCDIDDTACIGCRDAADDTDEQEFYYKTNSGAI